MSQLNIRLAAANDKFRQVLGTTGTSQVTALALKPRESASAGGPTDEHYLVVTGGHGVLVDGTLLTVPAGDSRLLSNDGTSTMKILKIGAPGPAAGSAAETREKAFQQDVERLTAKDYTVAERKDMAKSGEAMKDGTFPIKNQQDLNHAAQLWGHADNPQAAKAHIKKRAKQAGLSVPYSWQGDSDSDGI